MSSGFFSKLPYHGIIPSIIFLLLCLLVKYLAVQCGHIDVENHSSLNKTGLEDEEAEWCGSEGVDNTVLAFSTDFFIAVLVFGLALHLIGTTSRKVMAGIALGTLSGGFLFKGMAVRFFGNNGMDDGRGMEGFFFLTMCQYLLWTTSTVFLGFFVHFGWHLTNEETRICGSIESKIAASLNVLAAIGVVTGCMWSGMAGWNVTDYLLDEYPPSKLHDISIPIELLRIGQLVWHGSSCIFQIAMAYVLGALSQQRDMKPRGFHLYGSAFGLLMAQVALAVFVLFYALKDGHETMKGWGGTNGSTVSTPLINYFQMMSAFFAHNLLYTLFPNDSRTIHDRSYAVYAWKRTDKDEKEGYTDSSDDDSDVVAENTTASREMIDDKVNSWHFHIFSRFRAHKDSYGMEEDDFSSDDDDELCGPGGSKIVIRTISSVSNQSRPVTAPPVASQPSIHPFALFDTNLSRTKTSAEQEISEHALLDSKSVEDAVCGRTESSQHSRATLCSIEIRYGDVEQAKPEGEIPIGEGDSVQEVEMEDVEEPTALSAIQGSLSKSVEDAVCGGTESSQHSRATLCSVEIRYGDVEQATPEGEIPVGEGDSVQEVEMEDVEEPTAFSAIQGSWSKRDVLSTRSVADCESTEIQTLEISMRSTSLLSEVGQVSAQLDHDISFSPDEGLRQSESWTSRSGERSFPRTRQPAHDIEEGHDMTKHKTKKLLGLNCTTILRLDELDPSLMSNTPSSQNGKRKSFLGRLRQKNRILHTSRSLSSAHKDVVGIAGGPPKEDFDKPEHNDADYRRSSSMLAGEDVLESPSNATNYTTVAREGSMEQDISDNSTPTGEVGAEIEITYEEAQCLATNDSEEETPTAVETHDAVERIAAMPSLELPNPGSNETLPLAPSQSQLQITKSNVSPKDEEGLLMREQFTVLTDMIPNKECVSKTESELVSEYSRSGSSFGSEGVLLQESFHESLLRMLNPFKKDDDLLSGESSSESDNSSIGIGANYVVSFESSRYSVDEHLDCASRESFSSFSDSTAGSGPGSCKQQEGSLNKCLSKSNSSTALKLSWSAFERQSLAAREKSEAYHSKAATINQSKDGKQDL